MCGLPAILSNLFSVLNMKEIEGVASSLFFHRMSTSCYQDDVIILLKKGNGYGKTIKN